MVDNLRTQVLKWFVETGYMDGYGMGHWNGTTESVEVESESDAIALQNKWLEQGKLIRTHWGELRPNSGYGIFRIRSSWVDIQNPLTDHTEAQAAEIERLRGELAKALDALHEAWFMLTVPMLNYQPEPEEPGLRRIKDALDALTGAKP